LTSQQILEQAIQHLPALLLIGVSIYWVYWMVGLIAWPRLNFREAITDRFATLNPSKFRGSALSRLMLISFVGLFLELLLIRWIASEIRVFAYFKSLVLIACFLGFGLGCYLTRRKINLLYTLAPIAGLILLVELPWDPLRHMMVNLSAFIGWFSDVHMWSKAHFAGQQLWGFASAGIATGIVIALFGVIAVAFVPIGQLVGYYLENSGAGINGYSVNVLASIAGIWVYTALCFLSTPPVAWFLVFCAAMVLFFWTSTRLRNLLLIFSAVVLGLFAAGSQKRQWWGEEGWKGSRPEEFSLREGAVETMWSPYQKLSLIPLQKGTETVRYILNTNDSWYQQIINLSDSARAKNPELYEDGPIRFHQYNLPYQFYPRPQSVLIAGAGMGNDVAAALRNGAGHVTAVEIDPLILRNGRNRHLEQPYSSDRVTARVDDARHFIQSTTGRYDLIVFSILDSHTTSSHYTNIRLDNYVYTIESLQRTRQLLKPGGLFVMSFSSERPWFAGKLKELVTRAFDMEPVTVHADVHFFVVGDRQRIDSALASDPDLRQFIADNTIVKTEKADLPTDDWPYLYHQHRGIPLIVGILSVGLIAVCWFAFHGLKGAGEGIDLHFFFLGAAFMLIEVQVISKAALLFGTTWLVNSIIITGLLVFIVLANLVIANVRQVPAWLAYAGLFGSLAVSYVMPASTLMRTSLAGTAVLAVLVYCTPVFFAGLIFGSSFKAIGFRAESFGSNLLGSLVGGLLESLSFWTGIKSLVLLGALLYVLSQVTRARALSAKPSLVRTAAA
jgi:SAM-dependent methyltransferase